MSVITYGSMVHVCLEAAQRLAGEGAEAEVIDLRTLLPVDEQTVLASVRKTGKALIVHEDTLTGGYGAEIAAILAEHAFTDLDGPVMRLAGPDVPAVPYSHPLQDWFMPDAERIAQAIRKLAAF